ncbi:MAG: thioredoxin [Bacteroidales bacterium]|nr:thioredoxin [Bacteroidales bacterium]
MKKIIFLFVIALSLSIGNSSCKSGSSSEDGILVLNNDNFDKETAQGVVLVDFWATWCMPCRAMSPVIKELAGQTKGKIKVGKVDVDQNPELSRRFNVQNIPNLIILKDGKEVENLVGVQSKEALIQALEKYVQLQK